MAIERIGILTSGGDCAGLNAVIRAVVHRAILRKLAQQGGFNLVGVPKIIDNVVPFTENYSNRRQCRHRGIGQAATDRCEP
jgi:6-phosphofructokinase